MEDSITVYLRIYGQSPMNINREIAKVHSIKDGTVFETESQYHMMGLINSSFMIGYIAAKMESQKEKENGRL